MRATDVDAIEKKFAMRDRTLRALVDAVVALSEDNKRTKRRQGKAIDLLATATDILGELAHRITELEREKGQPKVRHQGECYERGGSDDHN